MLGAIPQFILQFNMNEDPIGQLGAGIIASKTQEN
jgi:hypothetical protein